MEFNLTAIPNSDLKLTTLQLDDLVFGCKFNQALIHQVVTAYLAGGRCGNKAQKTRREVRGGGIKPWKQKGTGRARAGSIRSPIWRGGGVTFAAKPRDYSQKINKKMFKGAMRSIFSELLRKGSLVLVENFSLDSNKTKELVKKLKDIELANVLIITEQVDLNLYLASRNLAEVGVCDVKGVDPVRLLNFDKILLTMPAVKYLQEMLG